MQPNARLIAICLQFLTILTVAGDPPPKDPNRIEILQGDGSRIIWTQVIGNIPNRKTLRKCTYAANGSLDSTVVYRLDLAGNALGGQILDNSGTCSYRLMFGYRDGKLAEERIYDAQDRRKNNRGFEGPIRRYVYTYDAAGNRLKPTVFDVGDIPKRFPKEPFEDPFAKKANP